MVGCSAGRFYESIQGVREMVREAKETGDRSRLLMQLKEEQVLHTVVQRQPFPLLFASLMGSHLYGLPSFDSDLDLRGAHVLPLDRVVGLFVEQETIEGHSQLAGVDVDLVTHDIKKYFQLLLKQNPDVLEEIYSPLVHHQASYFEELREIAALCVTRQFGTSYRAYGQKLWNSFERQRQLKPLLYVFRVILTGIHLMESGEVEANLMRLNHRFRLPYLGDLIALKLQGSEETLLEDVDIEFYGREFRRLMRELTDARLGSDLPEEPRGKPQLHDLLIRLRLEYEKG
jgi:uncharacterized protein